MLPWPSAYLKSVTLGHFAASSLPEAVVTSRQLLPPNPSSRAKLIFFVPHQSGAPATWVTLPLPPLPPPPELPPPQPASTMSSDGDRPRLRPGRNLRNLHRDVPSCEHGRRAVVPGAVGCADRSGGRRARRAGRERRDRRAAQLTV